MLKTNQFLKLCLRFSFGRRIPLKTGQKTKLKPQPVKPVKKIEETVNLKEMTPEEELQSKIRSIESSKLLL